VLGVFYREVARLSWIERLVAKTLFGGLPPASLVKSEEYLRKAVRADPESAFAAFELGQTLEALDRREEARDVYERLLGLEPRNSENLRDIEEARRWLAENPGG
jgi:tetratricopeptide (TPR) repeat protein